MMEYIALIVVLILLISAIWQGIQALLQWIRASISGQAIFTSNFIEPKALFLRQFGELPCICSIGNVDVSQLAAYILQGHAGTVGAVYQHNYYDWEAGEQRFSQTLYVLSNKILIELGDQYAEIYFSRKNYVQVDSLVIAFASYPAAAKVGPVQVIGFRREAAMN